MARKPLVQKVAQVVGAVSEMPDGRIRVRLHVKPGARVSQIVSAPPEDAAPQAADALGLQVAAPPRDGEANEEVVRFVAEQLGVRPRAVELLAGQRSRDKVLALEGLSVDFVRRTLFPK